MSGKQILGLVLFIVGIILSITMTPTMAPISVGGLYMMLKK